MLFLQGKKHNYQNRIEKGGKDENKNNNSLLFCLSRNFGKSGMVYSWELITLTSLFKKKKPLFASKTSVACFVLSAYIHMSLV